MAKRKTADDGESEIAGARVVRRSMRVRSTKEEEEPVESAKAPKTTKATVKGRGKPIKDARNEGEKEGKQPTTTLPAIPNTTPTTPTTSAAEAPDDAPPRERQYWLMKAEPESRLEKGHDVKFSIDDLAAKTEPEAWDGIRSYAARNNLRAMRKGDLAFFYHSSCKTPAIVGMMEVVAEHSPDFTAQDPKAAYYDPKDKDPANPRWSVVHVVFREKFANPLTLRELKDMQPGCEEIAGWSC
ncbi:hypothetical protein ACLOAV_000137 [Pseudogymnoascus australis]